MDRITDAFGWPLHDPAWVAKLAVIGLILLVPIAGAINGLGWMLAALDLLREGERRLPNAGFNYIGRGFKLFVVELIYGVAIALVAAVIYLPGLVVMVQAGRGPSDAALISLGVLLSSLTVSIATLGSLAITFATPAIVLAVDRGGIAGGLRVGQLARRVRGSLANTLIAGLMLIAAGFIGSLGVFVCGLGLVFTTAYSLAMQAWIVRSFELGSNGTRTS